MYDTIGYTHKCITEALYVTRCAQGGPHFRIKVPKVGRIVKF